MVYLCVICNKPAEEICQRCESASYCSTECLETDKELHDLLCEQHNAFTNSLPLQPENTVLGLHIGVDSPIPEFIWVHTDGSLPDQVPEYELQLPQLQQYLGCPPSETKFKEIGYSTYRTFQLRHHTIRLYSPQDLEQRQYPQANRYINQITQGGPYANHHRGPFVILSLARRARRDEPNHFLDITLSDFRVLYDYLRHGEIPLAAKKPSLFNCLSRPTLLPGIKICCPAEMAYYNCAKFVEVSVPRDHPIWDMKNPTPISKNMKIPLLVRQSLSRDYWDQRPELYENEAVSWLNRECQPYSPNWGFPLKEWCGGNGSALVVRMDGMELTMQQAMAMCEFCGGGSRGIGVWVDDCLRRREGEGRRGGIIGCTGRSL